MVWRLQCQFRLIQRSSFTRICTFFQITFIRFGNILTNYVNACKVRNKVKSHTIDRAYDLHQYMHPNNVLKCTIMYANSPLRPHLPFIQYGEN